MNRFSLWSLFKTSNHGWNRNQKWKHCNNMQKWMDWIDQCWLVVTVSVSLFQHLAFVFLPSGRTILPAKGTGLGCVQLLFLAPSIARSNVSKLFWFFIIMSIALPSLTCNLDPFGLWFHRLAARPALLHVPRHTLPRHVSLENGAAPNMFWDLSTQKNGWWWICKANGAKKKH